VLYHLSLTGAVTFRTTSHPDSEALTIPQSPPKIVPVPQIFRTPLLRAHMCTFTVCTNHKCWPLKKCVREHLSRRTEVGKEKVTYPIGRVLPPSLAIKRSYGGSTRSATRSSQDTQVGQRDDPEECTRGDGSTMSPCGTCARRQVISLHSSSLAYTIFL